MTRLALLSLASALGAAAVPLLAQPPADANRDAFYCDERKLGSWFYCNSEEAKRKAREQARPASPAIPATERMAQITAKLDELKAHAILEPTSENIVSYIRFQREQLDRASTFADVWGRSIWQNPDLDYTLEWPVSTLAKQTPCVAGPISLWFSSASYKYNKFWLWLFRIQSLGQHERKSSKFSPKSVER